MARGAAREERCGLNGYVEILIPLTQDIDALTQQRQLVMHDIAGIAGVGEPRIDCLEQPQPSIDLPEQQQATIAGDIPARKSGLDPVAFQRWKIKAFLGTFCHGQNLVRIQCNQLNFNELHGFCPFYL